MTAEAATFPRRSQQWTLDRVAETTFGGDVTVAQRQSGMAYRSDPNMLSVLGGAGTIIDQRTLGIHRALQANNQVRAV